MLTLSDMSQVQDITEGFIDATPQHSKITSSSMFKQAVTASHNLSYEMAVEAELNESETPITFLNFSI